MIKHNPESQQLRRTISFRLDEETYARFQEEAHKAGVTQGRLVRALLEGKKLPEHANPIDKQSSLMILTSLIHAERSLEELSIELINACRKEKIPAHTIDIFLGTLASINQTLREAVHHARQD
jgi:hypothetical protein